MAQNKKSTKKTISLIVPVYNERTSIEPFLERTIPVLESALDILGAGSEYEVIFVDDGSSDYTLLEITKARMKYSHINTVVFSRNFGKEAAVSAGLEYARGDAAIVIDVDLQDPPELIKDMVQHWVEGAKMATAVRADRSSDTYLKRKSAELFYATFNKLADWPMSHNAGDYRLMDRQIIDAINEMPDRTRFMKEIFSWVGFESAEIPYVREERFTGTTKWNYWKLWNFALDGITASTSAPLRVWTYVGLMLAGISFCYATFIVLKTAIFGADVPGYASLLTVVLFMGGVNLLSLGIIGEYVARIYNEVRKRPLFIVSSTMGFEAKTSSRTTRKAPAKPTRSKSMKAA